MADDKRNFRSYYYEKFGFRGVEEKKSIEILLNEKPLDLEKLSQFCLRFPVPSMHRAFVWKVLLGKQKLVTYSKKNSVIIYTKLVDVFVCRCDTSVSRRTRICPEATTRAIR